jgi:hypothetical protein
VLTIRRRTVVVNLVDGRTTLVGQRVLSWPWQIKLDAAKLLNAGVDTGPIDGQVVVPRRQIQFLQVVR